MRPLLVSALAALCTGPFGGVSFLAPPTEDVALCGRGLLLKSAFPFIALPGVVKVREQSDCDLRSSVLADFFVGDATGRRGFLMVGDFLGDKMSGSCLVPGFEARGGEVFDFEGGLEAGLGPLAFIGELELRPGGLLLAVDLIGSDDGMSE